MKNPSTGLRFLFLVGCLLAAPFLNALTITEICYHTDDLEDPTESLEFIEVYNDDSIAIDLGGYRIAEGVQFTFPEETYLASRSFLVVCANRALIQDRYGIENAIGNYVGRLDNGGERISIVTPTGSPVSSVRYRDRGDWPTAADGTGYTLASLDVLGDEDDPANWTRSGQVGGTPGMENFPEALPIDHEIFPEGVSWKLRKGWDEGSLVMAEFSDPDEAWRREDFDDASWVDGLAPIGMNEAEIKTPLDDMRNQYLAFAVRRWFTIDQEAIDDMVSLVIKVRVDDGFVCYLNGEEIGRFNLDGEIGTAVPVDATAKSWELSREPQEVLIPKARVRPGENLLAFQVHNQRLGSSDAGFVASVHYRRFQHFPSPPVPTVVFNEVSFGPSGRALELYNRTRSTVNLSGHHLTHDPALPRLYTFPAGSSIPAGGYLSVPEAELGFPLDAARVSAFLYRPELDDIVDALSLENPPPATAGFQTHSRFPDGRGPWCMGSTATPGEANRVELEDGLVINEIHYNPLLMNDDGTRLEDSSRGEFLELYNRSDRDVPLEGFSLSGGYRFAFGPEHVLRSGEYLVVARDPVYIRETYGLDGDFVLGPGPDATDEQLAAFGALANSGEAIRLEDRLGNVIDEVRYHEEGEWDGLADGGGSSLELVDPHQDNRVAQAWRASLESQKSEWTRIEYDAPYPSSVPPGQVRGGNSEMHLFLLSGGECLIDDVSLKVTGNDAELIRNGEFETDLRPWRLMGNHETSTRSTADAKSGAGSMHLIASGGGNSKYNRLESDTVSITGSEVHVRLWARWLAGSNALHVSGHNNVYGRTVWLSVPRRTGTPGAENSVRVALRDETGTDNLGPVISEVRHAPAVPAPLEPIRFHARISDPDGLESAVVRYAADGDAEIRVATLLDDGAGGDELEGDGEHVAEIAGLPLGTIINFWLEAEDRLANVHIYPRGAPQRRLSFIVDRPMESATHRYRLVLNREALSVLPPLTQQSPRDLHSNRLVDGTFIFEESKVYYNVGFRYHGSPWNRPPSPRMFRVRFNGDRLFRGEAKRINISRYGSAQNEGTAYQILRKASAPGAEVPHTQRYNYAFIKLNQALHSRSMAEVRAIDSHYADYNWPHDSDGQTWKITGKIAFTDGGTMEGSPVWTRFNVYRSGPYPGTESKENLRFYYNPKIRKDLDSFAPLAQMLRTMDRSTTPDSDYEEKIENIVNLEAFFRTHIVRTLQDDWDTIDIGNGQNAYVYFAPIEGRHYLVPWDMDHTFGNTNQVLIPANSSSGIGRMVSKPKFRRLYAVVMKEILDGPWREQYLDNWTSLVNETKIGRHTPDVLMNFVRTRRRNAMNFLQVGLNASFEITTESPAFTSTDSIILSGRAHLDVAQFFVGLDGSEPTYVEDVNWTAPSAVVIPTTWSLEVRGLKPGSNRVEIVGQNTSGEVVDTLEIEVVNTSTLTPLGVTALEPPSGPETGGTLVEISGEGFHEPLGVRFGGQPAAVEPVSQTLVRALTPPGEAGTVSVEVTSAGRSLVLPDGFLYESRARFRRGDANADGKVNIVDAVTLLRHLFQGVALACEDGADADDDGVLDSSDAVYLIRYLYLEGSAPPPPYPEPGVDPTSDLLDCAVAP